MVGFAPDPELVGFVGPKKRTPVYSDAQATNRPLPDIVTTTLEVPPVAPPGVVPQISPSTVLRRLFFWAYVPPPVTELTVRAPGEEMPTRTVRPAVMAPDIVIVHVFVFVAVWEQPPVTPMPTAAEAGWTKNSEATMMDPTTASDTTAATRGRATDPPLESSPRIDLTAAPPRQRR